MLSFLESLDASIDDLQSIPVVHDFYDVFDEVQRMVLPVEYFEGWHLSYECVCTDGLAAKPVGCMGMHTFHGEWKAMKVQPGTCVS